MSYYNTTHLAGQALKEARAKAKTQKEKIMILFRRYPHRMFTPFEVGLKVFPNNPPPITSVRRAITDLTTAGALRKTQFQRKGVYGKSCYCWQLKR